MTEQGLSGCEKCFQADAEAMDKARVKFARIARLVDESHFDISILACPACGQHWVSIFTEWIDWQDGDDPQYISELPVTEKESKMLIAGGKEIEKKVELLGRKRRHLRVDHPKGGPRRIGWSDFALLIGPHD